MWSQRSAVFLCLFVTCKSQKLLFNPESTETNRTGAFIGLEGHSARHIVKSTYVNNEFSCILKCLSHPTCQSINYKNNGNPMHHCELSETSIVSSPLCQEPRPGYSFFYPAQQPPFDCTIAGNSCKNGGTCTDRGCGGYICSCQRYNTGHYCEEWTTDVHSCKDILSRTSYRENIAYTFPIGPNQVTIYCHMTSDVCSAGGWTLTMKIDGSKTTQFGQSSSLWTNKQSYNEKAGQTGFDNQQTKMPSYWEMPFDKLCVGMKVNNVLKWVLIPYKANSLYDVIADGSYRATGIGRAKWMSLIGGSSLQSYCNKEGFNTDRFRLGIISNNENDCLTADSAIGFGLTGSFSCGNYCKFNHCSNSAKSTQAFGYIMIQ